MTRKNNKVYENCKIYGPYVSKKDNRYRVVIVSENNNKKTVSYPKYLMEVYLNRYLNKDETVDHIDGDVTHNVIENFRIIERKKHIKQDVIRYKDKEFICPYCNKKFVLNGRKLHYAIHNRKANKVGPFCSKKCAGKYGTDIQYKNKERIKVVNIKPEYIKNKNLPR